MYIASHKYTIERMAEAFGAPRWYNVNDGDIDDVFWICLFEVSYIFYVLICFI